MATKKINTTIDEALRFVGFVTLVVFFVLAVVFPIGTIWANAVLQFWATR